MIEAVRRQLLLFALLAALAPLVVALGAQYLGGLQPCPLCLWQRYPYVVAALLAAIAWWAGARSNGGANNAGVERALLRLTAVAFLVSAGIAVFHVGVEHKWWEGTAGCVGSIDFGGMTVEEMQAALEETAPARCDEAAWSFLGLSMAGFNAIYGGGAAILLALLATGRRSVP
ncbi:MAG: disulfide bond formation protein B [Dongiaceae bacterium]